MKKMMIVASAFILLTVCGDAFAEHGSKAAKATATQIEQQQTKTATKSEGSELSKEASKWVDQTKKLGETAWESSKKTAEEAYEATKEVSGDAYDATKKKSSSAWQATKKA